MTGVTNTLKLNHKASTKQVSIDALHVIFMKGKRWESMHLSALIFFSCHADLCMYLKLGFNCQIEPSQFVSLP